MIGKKTFLAAIGLSAVLAAAGFAQSPPPPAQGPGGGPGGGPMAGPMAAPRGGPVEMFFARNDANKDGKVTLDELTAQAKKLIESVDTDKDGAISKEEMKKHFEKMWSERAGRGPRGGPDGAGPQGAGPQGRPGAGPEGRPGRGRNGGRRQRPSAEDIFKKMDTNGDGQVSLDEFKAFHEQRRQGDRPRRGPPPDGGR